MSKVITPIIFIIIAVGLFFSYIRPAYDILLAFKEQAIRLDASIVKTDDLLEKHDRLLGKYSSISPEDRQKLEQLLPTSIDVVHLIIDIDALSTRRNLKIRSFGIPDIETKEVVPTRRGASENTQGKDDDLVDSATITIECDGEYSDFKMFLYDIEKNLSLMDLIGLDIDVSDITQVNTENEIVYEFELQTYWLK